MMGSTLRRLWIYYSHNLRRTHKVALLLLVAISCYFIGSRLFGGSGKYGNHGNVERSPFGAVRYRMDKEPERMDDTAIRKTLDLLVDTRPMRCRDSTYEFTRLDADETISIVMEFHGAAFYDLKLAVTAIVEHTPYDLYNEIVVLDDGTTSEGIRKQAALFFQDPKFNKVKVYRSESHDGQSASWFKAAAASTGSILVFVDSSAVVGHSWIQPLISKVIDDPKLIAVPHANNLLDDDRFFRTDDWLINVFTWSLSTVHYEKIGNKDDVMDTPVTRGDVMVMRRSFLEVIGGFDDRLKPESGGGLHLELSLRAWMCGAGAVRIVTCSRVAVRNSLRSRRVADAFNYRRIVELWFGEFRSIALRQGRVSMDMDAEEKLLLTQRRASLQQTVQGECKTFGWFLKNVATMVIAPSDNVQHFGKLRAKTGYCIHAQESGEVQMALCREYMYEPVATFEMNADGVIFRGDLCLEPDQTGRVYGRPCSDESPNQRWRFASRSRLQLVTHPDACLAQVSERDANSMDLSHYAKLVKCSDVEADQRKQIWKFLNF